MFLCYVGLEVTLTVPEMFNKRQSLSANEARLQVPRISSMYARRLARRSLSLYIYILSSVECTVRDDVMSPTDVIQDAPAPRESMSADRQHVLG